MWKKNLLNCFQTVKTSEKEENQKMNLVKIFSCMKPKENVFNPENRKKNVSLCFIHEFKKQCKEQNKDYLLSLLYSGEFETK